MQAKEKVDLEEKRRREEELLAMEKLNGSLNQKIGSLHQEIRTLRDGGADWYLPWYSLISRVL